MTMIKKALKYKALVAAVLLALVIGISGVINTPSAYGWNGETEGNSQTENSNSVNGSTSGETNVQGWIGTFDGTENPERPDPPAEDWINVKIPVTALFGSLASDEGVIYSPEYSIYNYSIRGVDISPSAFTVKTEPNELSGMTLGLNFTEPAASFVLRNAENQFLGNGITANGNITLASGSQASPTVASFNMSGQLPENFTYPAETPYQPTYGLVFTFEAQAPVAAG